MCHIAGIGKNVRTDCDVWLGRADLQETVLSFSKVRTIHLCCACNQVKLLPPSHHGPLNLINVIIVFFFNRNIFSYLPISIYSLKCFSSFLGKLNVKDSQHAMIKFAFTK